MEHSFEQDNEIGEAARGMAEEAVEWAADSFDGPRLDWTDESVQGVEMILSMMHQAMASEQPDDDTVWGYAQLLGSYIGEVIRRNHGGTWGLVTLDGEQYVGMQSGDELFWPWIRVLKRIKNGPEENV